ncbi:PREDICTED: uncharacterized protein LOC109356275 [Lupinus angustifolius]|uniref:uncharacterized protein LOC109356275 n=1 Tax=Lupinus angustifolius TaxID=3871 RepID=UPI00092FCD60|nr:PREDICTED: uncharacterized protein LOC109356275 [Lupinus angustifolius]
MTSFKAFWVISCIAYQAFYAKVNGAKSHVPALYVFGDSGLDAGNNNNLKTLAKANVAPYGIDFNNTSTGRYTNGKTFADLIAIKLGLPFSPPYLGVSESRRYLVTAGVNYASGACGILNDTKYGECLSLDKQIEYFTSTVTQDLPKHFESDFNVILGSNEYRGSRIPSRVPSEEFKTFSDNVGLIYLITTGAEFTWSNNRMGPTLTEKRPDRAICNEEWISNWHHHPDYIRVIEESWRARVYGCPMFILASKLRRLKIVLKVWNVCVLGNVHQKVKDAMNEVHTIQNCINELGQDNDYLDQDVLAQKNLLIALNMEEDIWKEKARVNWHINSDRNTSFFHRVTKIRQVSKSMNLLKVGEEVITD